MSDSWEDSSDGLADSQSRPSTGNNQDVEEPEPEIGAAEEEGEEPDVDGADLQDGFLPDLTMWPPVFVSHEDWTRTFADYVAEPVLSHEDWTRTFYQCPCPLCHGHWWWVSTLGRSFCEDAPLQWTRYAFNDPFPGFWWHHWGTGEYFFEPGRQPEPSET